MIAALGRISIIGVFLGGAWALGGSGCVRKVQDHCANLSGDASCRGYFDEARPFCSACDSANHGCLAAPPEEDEEDACWAKGKTPSDPPVDDTGTVTSSDSGSGSGSGDTGGDETPVVTGDGSGSGSGSESGSDGPAAECGNGIIEGDEDCDGTELGGADCSMFGSSGDGLACGADCLFDPSECEGFSCGDGMVSGSEQCDGDNLAGHDCSTQERVATEGTLQCSNCLFNTTECCIPSMQPCATDSDCCSGKCNSLLPPLTGKSCGMM